MNELILSTYIQIMQEGLVTHDKQESAGRFILESITIQSNALCTTDLNSKKISRLVNRKDPVPDDIKQASLKAEVVDEVKEYFKNNVVPDLNRYTKFDTLEKIMNVITQDGQIAKLQKDIFQRIYDSDNEVEFLAEAFLYCLQRNNKVQDDKVDYQDAPLLAEVNYECPLSHVKLVEEIKGVPKKNYEITQIFPEGLSVDLENDFSVVYPKPRNLDDPSNLIALSIEAANNYLMKPTVEEYKELVEIKQVTVKKYKAINAINRIELEEEIRSALDALTSLSSSNNLPKLSYDALRIDEKIENALLQSEVRNHVVSYYGFIENTFSESVDNFDEIAAEVRLSSQKLENAGLDQESIIIALTDWIHNKAFTNGERGKLACRIVVCFFIQNCEVFHQ